MIDAKAAQKALSKSHGNISKAARALDVPSSELRKFAAANPAVWDAALEAAERGLDKAEQVILDGMDSSDPMKRLEAAKLILKGRFRDDR